MTVLHEGKVPFWCMRCAVRMLLLFVAVYIHWINLCFWETAHLPLHRANIITYFSLRAKCWLKGRDRWAVSQKPKLIPYGYIVHVCFVYWISTGCHNNDPRSLPRNAKLKELCLTIYRKIPKISPSKYKSPKPVTQKTLR